MALTLDDYERRYPPRQLPPGAEVGRVAPSPTGRPHIGTALQAVINRGLATKTHGVFMLRIEDTDRARLVPGAVQEIIESLRWLGVEPDEGPATGGAYEPYEQSQRLPIYKAAADQLVAAGHAYHCFCSAERLETVRNAQMAEGRPMRYDGLCRSLDAAEVAGRLEAGRPSVIRMRIPADEAITFEDMARGAITIASDQVDDAVIMKSDGFPTYHLAVVVDDHFMHVTTVVRGEEWISSTPKHLLLYRQLGWTPPRFLHTALLRDASGRKLSKRSGDTSIGYFREQGILPEAFRNFLTRVVWFHPDSKDVYEFSDFVSFFELSRLSVSGPVVDAALLLHINSLYIRRFDADALFACVVDHLQLLTERGTPFTDSFEGGTGVTIAPEELKTFVAAFVSDPAKARRILSLEPERFKRLTDVLIQGRMYYEEFFTPPADGAIAGQMGGAAAAQAFLEDMCAKHDDLVPSKETWDAYVRGQAGALGLKPGKLFMALRLAITGTQMSPPLFEILHVLGSDEVRRRLRLALDRLTQSA
jgi:glutamyl-tRNA synthetase